MTLTWILMATVLGLAVVLAASARVVKQFERGVLFRFGRVTSKPAAPDSPSSCRAEIGCKRSTCRSSPCPSQPRTASPATM